MLDTRSLNVIEINPTAESVVREIHPCVTLQSVAYPTYLLGKYIVAREFNRRYPKYPIDIIEPHDSRSVLISSDSGNTGQDGIVRICFDTDKGLPIIPYIRREYMERKEKGLKVAEVGRLFVEPASRAYPHFMALVYLLALELEIDCYLIQVRSKNVKAYQNLFGAKVLVENKRCEDCTHMAWDIASTPQEFWGRFPVDATADMLAGSAA